MLSDFITKIQRIPNAIKLLAVIGFLVVVLIPKAPPEEIKTAIPAAAAVVQRNHTPSAKQAGPQEEIPKKELEPAAPKASRPREAGSDRSDLLAVAAPLKNNVDQSKNIPENPPTNDTHAAQTSDSAALVPPPIPTSSSRPFLPEVSTSKDVAPRRTANETKGSADTSVSIRQNLARCLNGGYPCDMNLLTTDQLAQKNHNDVESNLRRCLSGGYPCYTTLLTSDQLAQNNQNEVARNLRRCLSGGYPCDTKLLTPDQLAQNDQNEVARNLRRCLSGGYPCDTKLLTPDQLAQNNQNEAARNLRRCLSGGYPCDTKLLTSGELAQKNQNDVERNLRRCMSGGYPCDTNLLTLEQRVQVAQRKRP